ncbi:putative uncharacterized protein DDB_G0282133 [Teleopsis dalmanni]|uniref:putative uncharacterized protein DDB_G0282133 n=1 Tax=Teleopsis dalmanni TaxID=139649 RepID=UPI0018CFE821|nr:putative uncharacterized protein DDB_G0282133 [Teleopsis dalmanni]
MRYMLLFSFIVLCWQTTAERQHSIHVLRKVKKDELSNEPCMSNLFVNGFLHLKGQMLLNKYPNVRIIPFELHDGEDDNANRYSDPLSKPELRKDYDHLAPHDETYAKDKLRYNDRKGGGYSDSSADAFDNGNNEDMEQINVKHYNSRPLGTNNNDDTFEWTGENSNKDPSKFDRYQMFSDKTDQDSSDPFADNNIKYMSKPAYKSFMSYGKDSQPVANNNMDNTAATSAKQKGCDPKTGCGNSNVEGETKSNSKLKSSIFAAINPNSVFRAKPVTPNVNTKNNNAGNQNFSPNKLTSSNSSQKGTISSSNSGPSFSVQKVNQNSFSPEQQNRHSLQIYEKVPTYEKIPTIFTNKEPNMIMNPDLQILKPESKLHQTLRIQPTYSNNKLEDDQSSGNLFSTNMKLMRVHVPPDMVRAKTSEYKLTPVDQDLNNHNSIVAKDKIQGKSFLSSFKEPISTFFNDLSNKFSPISKKTIDNIEKNPPNTHYYIPQGSEKIAPEPLFIKDITHVGNNYNSHDNPTAVKDLKTMDFNNNLKHMDNSNNLYNSLATVKDYDKIKSLTEAKAIENINPYDSFVAVKDVKNIDTNNYPKYMDSSNNHLKSLTATKDNDNFNSYGGLAVVQDLRNIDNNNLKSVDNSNNLYNSLAAVKDVDKTKSLTAVKDNDNINRYDSLRAVKDLKNINNNNLKSIDNGILYNSLTAIKDVDKTKSLTSVKDNDNINPYDSFRAVKDLQNTDNNNNLKSMDNGNNLYNSLTALKDVDRIKSLTAVKNNDINSYDSFTAVKDVKNIDNNNNMRGMDNVNNLYNSLETAKDLNNIKPYNSLTAVQDYEGTDINYNSYDSPTAAKDSNNIKFYDTLNAVKDSNYVDNNYKPYESLREIKNYNIIAVKDSNNIIPYDSLTEVQDIKNKDDTYKPYESLTAMKELNNVDSYDSFATVEDSSFTDNNYDPNDNLKAGTDFSDVDYDYNSYIRNYMNKRAPVKRQKYKWEPYRQEEETVMKRRQDESAEHSRIIRTNDEQVPEIEVLENFIHTS